MITVIGIGGEPATGKSSLFSELINLVGEPRPIKYRVCQAAAYDAAQIIVLGIYDGSTFQGTDRLSMGVQPHALEFVTRLHKNAGYHGWRVLFEGDRLFNSKFISSIQSAGIPHHFYVLEAGEAMKSQRHHNRGDTQTATWLKGRVTKTQNILSAHPHVQALRNETYDDQISNVRLLLELA